LNGKTCTQNNSGISKKNSSWCNPKDFLFEIHIELMLELNIESWE